MIRPESLDWNIVRYYERMSIRGKDKIRKNPGKAAISFDWKVEVHLSLKDLRKIFTACIKDAELDIDIQFAYFGDDGYLLEKDLDEKRLVSKNLCLSNL
ncbi:MAG: hypothetical protein P8X79_15605 [Reinekea sp.]